MQFNKLTGLAELTNQEKNVLMEYIIGIGSAQSSYEFEHLNLSIPFPKSGIDAIKAMIDPITKDPRVTSELLNQLIMNIIIVSFSYLSDFAHCSALVTKSSNPSVMSSASEKLQAIIDNMNVFKEQQTDGSLITKPEDLN